MSEYHSFTGCLGSELERIRVVTNRLFFAAIGPVLFFVFVLAGCGGGTGTSGGTKGTSAEKTDSESSAERPEATAVLQRLLATYRDAKSYSDVGKVRLSFRQNGELIQEEWTSAVRFARPNRLSIEAFQAQVACNGRELKARIEDPTTGNVDGQILVRPAPAELKLKDLASDPLLYDILSSQLQRQPIQVELLLESGGLASAFGDEVACKLLPDAELEGKPCHCVEVPSPGGAFIFWIDVKSSLLRRLEYPAASLLPEMANDPGVSELRLTAELLEAQLNEEIPATSFDLEIPPQSKQVQSFVIPPRPLPTDLLGKQPGDFFLTTTEGQLKRDELLGKVAVLAWFRDHPACEATLQQLERVRQEYESKQDVAFVAVSTDPTTTSTADLGKLLENWGVALPLARDLDAFGDSVMKIQVQPTIVVLNAEGKVQIFQPGGSPDLAKQLSLILERLLKGEDVAAQILARASAEQIAYEKLVTAGGSKPSEVQEIPQAVIKKRREPRTLKLRELWTTSELKSPGNLYLVNDSAGTPRIVVCDGWRVVAELDAEGKLLARHELPIPPQAAVTYLRSAKTAQGKSIYLGAAPLAPQFFVFDDSWKLQLSHPAKLDDPLRLCDLQIANLGGDDGLAIYAGYLDLGGVQCMGLDGTVRWRNRAFASALSLAVAPADKGDDMTHARLLVTGESGSVLGINRFGNEEPPREVGMWPVVRVAAAQFPGATQAAFLGITSDPQGKVFATGFDGKLKEWWRFPLPEGAHQKPIEPVTSGSLLSGRVGTWAIACPDGSIFIISEDGEFSDSFQVGAPLSGLAIGKLGEVPVLIVATESAVTAWEVR